MSNKTRRADDFAWYGTFWPGYAEAAGYAVASPRGQITGRYVNASDDAGEPTLDAMLANPPHLLCVNNGTTASADRVREWLEHLKAKE